MYELLKELFPICRSITGEGNRKTLKIIQKIIPKLKIKEIKSGTKVFDWKIPPEWNIYDAYVKDENGKKIIDFKKNNLHIVSYSEPVKKIIAKKELIKKLHSLPKQPNAIPYVTSYYNKYWGFCVSETLKNKIKKSRSKYFNVVIDSSFRKKGSLTYAEYLIKGKSKKEILISTYICHPSLANNELSGPVVSTYLAKHFEKLKNYYSIRFLFVPETIGAITYINKNLKSLQKNVIAGYVLTCIGDERKYSYLFTKNSNTLSDRAAVAAFNTLSIKYNSFSFLDRGSDERQYNFPGVDLPIGSIMRSKYGEYKEYHTSLDNLNFVSEKGLKGGYDIVKKTIEIIMKNRIPLIKSKCEPNLGKRGLYPLISTKKENLKRRNMMNFIVFSDGKNDLLKISSLIKVDFSTCDEICSLLEKQNLITSSKII